MFDIEVLGIVEDGYIFAICCGWSGGGRGRVFIVDGFSGLISIHRESRRGRGSGDFGHCTWSFNKDW